MKIKSILLAGLIALGFAACNNEDAPQINTAEATVSIKVVPSSNGTTLKAVENLTNGVSATGLAAESKINQLEVYVFDAITNALDGYKSATIADGATPEVKEINVTPGNKIIMVVANGAVGTKDTKTDLLDATKELPAVANNLPMTGESSTIVLNPGQNYYGYPAGTGTAGDKLIETGNPLKIQRVNARVAIVAADLELPDEQKVIFDNLRDVEVAMFNVPKASKLFGNPATLAVNSTFQHGQTWETTATPPTYTGTDVMASLLDATVTFPIKVDAAPHYYVTENTSTTAQQQMFIVLRGKAYKGNDAVVSEGLYTDAAGYTYYPVWVNAPDHDYTGDNTGDSKIRRNTQYNISLTIKKIGNPTIDIVEDAWLDVVVEVVDWAVVTQDVTWQ